MKQFSKFKQFADKAFVRPDKTEVMSENLLDAERHIDLMKLTCETTVKKLGAFIQVSGQAKEGATIARRIKKVPEWVLGSSLDELGKKYEEGSVLGTILTEAGKIEMTIGSQMTALEGKVEPIIADIQKLVDNEFPSIFKLKRNLAKLSENMDTAKNKLQQANRHSMSTATGGRIENFKDELDESQVKVEQCRDNLASEMYQLLSKQTDIAQSIVQFLKYQQEYHQYISNTLSDLLPEVEAALATSTTKPVYGTDLTEHLTTSGRTIAYPLEFCVCCLLETGLKEEGLFRIAGSASKVKKLKSAFNAWILDSDLKGLMAEFNDPHVVGNALKCYLRELPNPLLTTELYNDWINAIRVQDNPEKLQSLWNVVQKLPEGNRENLRYLIKFLRKLSDHQDVNKMSSANIAIVLGPNVLWSPQDDMSGDSHSTPMGLNMAMTHWFSSIVEQLVTYADWFFPGEMEFYVTCEKPEPEWVSVNLRHLSGSVTGSIPNGSSTEDILDDNQALKRSQSNSSLDEHSGQNGSPKPVIRRKVKPAPLPPTTNTVATKATGTKQLTSDTIKAEAKIITTHDPPKQTQQSQQPQRPPPIDSTKPFAATKREGMWIPPPSPSQMSINNNRVSYVPGPTSTFTAPQPIGSAHPTSQPIGTGHPAAPKAVPPKPPQPSFIKDKTGSTEPNAPTTVSSTLRHKSSFRTPSKMDSRDGTEGGAGGTSYASLPRRFHSDNSYKNASPPKVMDIFPAKTEPVPDPPKPVVEPPKPLTEPPKPKEAPKHESKLEPVGKHESKTEPLVKDDNKAEPSGKDSRKSSIQNILEIVTSPVTKSFEPGKEIGGVAPPHIGFEKIVSQIDSEAIKLKVLGEDKVSDKPEGIAESTMAGSPTEPKIVTTRMPTADSPRPVPAPRSSLHKDVFPDHTSPKTVPLQKERPSVMAKPRDLGKRTHGGDHSFPTHCRNSSGSGQESESDILGDGKVSTPTSQPTSRTHSRIGSAGEELKVNDVILNEQEKEPRGSIPGEEEVGGHGNGSSTSSRMPLRPPRPNPPAPPKVKTARDSSTDM